MATLSLNKASSPRLAIIRADKQLELEKLQRSERLRKNSLATKWIKQFPIFKKHLLLKQGIHKDLADHYEAGDYKFGKTHIRCAINRHVRSKKYQALALDGDRFDLNAKKVEISPEIDE